jgi:hypothetical protein
VKFTKHYKRWGGGVQAVKVLGSLVCSYHTALKSECFNGGVLMCVALPRSPGLPVFRRNA